MKKTPILIGIGVVLLVGILYFTGLGQQLTASVVSQNAVSATIHTNFGNIKIKLAHDEAPNLAENFQRLAEAGKYNGTIFHRVINGFMIQGGDFENSDGTGGVSWRGYDLPDEFSPNLSHVRGAVSMANRGPDTNGSQFFIVQKDAKFLDGRHSIFGQVVDGMSVVDKIAESKTDLNDRPLEKIQVSKVTLEY